MKKLLLLATLTVFFYIAVSAQQTAGQGGGCCCDPILHNGSLVPERTECDEPYFQFTDQISLGQSCNDACNATFGVPINATPILNCESPLYKPPPGNLQIRPVKGKKQLRLTFTLPCPKQTLSLNISRCTGDDCDDFVRIAEIAPATVFIDTDPSLLWNQVYTYRVESNSRFSGRSEPAIGSKSPGDIECWNKGYDKFCVSDLYYERFANYLSENGYYDTSADIFAENFESAVNAVFLGKFNKGSFCSEENLLGQGTACPEGKQCIADGDVYCISPVECGNEGGIFGLYSTQPTCEGGIPPNNKYCFFDRSHTSVDDCFSCNPQMSCADYRSKGACERDNCHAGNCSWHPVLNDIGIGVCVDKRFPNCLWCTIPGTPNMENLDAYNEVFDQCTAKKSEALSITNYTCVYDKNAQESNACDAAACMDYSDKGCGSPQGGITLNPDNSLATFSRDACNIQVCQNISGIGCTKNHDGNSAPDCSPLADDRRKCELDYFPPNTTMIPIMHKPAWMNWLDIQMLDKFNATHDGVLMQGEPGYRTGICVVSEETPCDDASEFSETNLSMLNFNDLYLQSGRDVLATMSVGENTLKYYGIDSRNNPEVVKNMTILACNLCQGPKVLEVSVTPSRKYEGKFYTIADIPVITVSFNEPASLTFAALSIGGKVMPVSSSPAEGMSYEYTFIPLNPLPDNEYTLTFNAKDSNGLLMDSPGNAVIVVDTTPGNVQIIPSDGSVINETSAEISFIFTEPLTLISATFEDEIWTSKYATKKITTDLVPLLTVSEDGLTYSTTLDMLSGGKKNLRIQAEDFAGNPTIGKSSFWINQGRLQIRMREPAWGVSSNNVFDIIVETSIASKCKYAYGMPVPFPITAFDEALSSFPSETEVVHKLTGFDKIPVGDTNPHKLHVYCKSGTNITVESFDLRVDPTPPVIRSAYAQPAVIIEPRTPGADIYSTYLKAQTDDEGFCKYSTDNVPFILMNGLFSGFDEIPKRSHDAEINVTQDNASYTYYVACKNTAQLTSATVPVKFSVDTSIPFSATSMTPPYSNSTDFSLRIETNKRAFCYIGESAQSVITLMGESGYEFGYAHPYPVSVNDSGSYTWFVKCSTGAGTEVIDLQISVIVDTTPPEMIYVNDSSNLPEEPEISYFPNQLQVKFLGFDLETSVLAYYYRIMTFHSNDTVLNWTMSTNLNGTQFYVIGLNLTDGNKYKFETYPVNILGLKGDAMDSNGVTIDFEKSPTSCENGALDSDEADVDCGGICAGCLDGANCNADTDCISGFCNDGICSIISCDDGVKNGNETGIDCGGGVCLACELNNTCVDDSDCASGSCNFGICGNLDACDDGVLSGTETDIDCGGSCSNKCGDSKNCQITGDCAEGLMCIESTCRGTRDNDNDGVADDKDKCPNTPADEAADSEGCSPSQKFSCADAISDGWRIKYFGSVLCTGDGAPDADPDKDGLTNLEEYTYGTNPKNPDTDYDGWTDKQEIDAGTNPIDASSHPPSKLRILLWLFLILFILAVLGVGGWLGYQYLLEKKIEQIPPAIPARKPAPQIPARKLRKWPSVIEQLRKIAHKEEPGVTDTDWVSLGALADQLKKEKIPVSKDVFARLNDLLSGKIPKKEAKSILAEIRKEPDAFRLLRRISFEKLSSADKEMVRKRLSFLKEGRLTSAELEEILTKLRITAAYYKTHAEELERELETWLHEDKRRKK